MKKYAFLLLLPLAWGCDVLSGEETYDVRGRVVNAQTGQPIEDMFVALGCSYMGFTVFDSTRTNINGEFRIVYSHKKGFGETVCFCKRRFLLESIQ